MIMSLRVSGVSFSHLLATTVNSLWFNCGVFTDIFYVVEQKVKMFSSACGDHRPYFRHLPEAHTLKPLRDKGTGSSKEPTSFSGFRTHSCGTALLIKSIWHETGRNVHGWRTFTKFLPQCLTHREVLGVGDQIIHVIIDNYWINLQIWMCSV